METLVQHQLQIIAFDHEEGIYFVLTWNFISNMESCCKQFKKADIEDEDNYCYVVKGMHQKNNYLLTKQYLTDLEYNIPLRQRNVNQNLDLSNVSYTKKINCVKDFFNQRKIFSDNQVFLGVEKACSLFHPVSKMDLMLWRDINELGEKASMIDQICHLEHFNLIFEGISLFHYFSDNSDMIEII